MAFDNYDKCSLLLPMNGANNGTTFTDWSPTPKTVTANGNAKTSTTQSKYYGSSGYFDGTGDYLNIGSAVIPATTDFTIAFWARPSEINATTHRTIVAQKSLDGVYNAGRFHISVGPSAQSGKVFLFIGGTPSLELRSTSSFAANTWAHVAITRISNIFKIYFNGVLEATSSSFAQAIEQQSTLVGRYGDGTAAGELFGYLQDLLVINGAALWTSNFTPPTRLVGTISGTVYDKDGAVASRSIIAVPRSYPSKVFSTTSSAGDGTYSLTLPATEMSVIGLANESVLREDKIERVIPE